MEEGQWLAAPHRIPLWALGQQSEAFAAAGAEPESGLQPVLLWCRHISFRLVRHGTGFLLSQVFTPAGSPKAAMHRHVLKISTTVC